MTASKRSDPNEKRGAADAEKRALVFPEHFTWGTSTAGHQIEGGNVHSDWWAFEHEGKINDGTVSGRAVDYWNRFEDDHRLMKELGYPAFRLGIEWAKIEPRPGEIDRDALAHYRTILESLRRHDISICLTLYHWVVPKWFQDDRGWEHPDAVNRFMKYCDLVIRELGEYPDLWITLNEPMVPALAGNLIGYFPPKKRSFLANCNVTAAHLKAHARCYHRIHELVPHAPDGGPTMVGVATAYQYFEPWGTGGLPGRYEELMTRIARFGSYAGWDRAIATGELPFPFGRGRVRGLENSYDYIGVNYYMRFSPKFAPDRPDQAMIDIEAVPAEVEETEMGWQVYPPGLYNILKSRWEKFKKPIFITENGIADSTDTMRPKYLLEHLAQVHRAIEDGCDVRGYFQWSFTDNFEWREGFGKKFGLVAVDHRDPALERHPRPSAKMYGDIIEANAITGSIVNNYSPNAYEGVFGDRWNGR